MSTATITMISMGIAFTAFVFAILAYVLTNRRAARQKFYHRLESVSQHKTIVRGHQKSLFAEKADSLIEQRLHQYLENTKGSNSLARFFAFSPGTRRYLRQIVLTAILFGSLVSGVLVYGFEIKVSIAGGVGGIAMLMGGIFYLRLLENMQQKEFLKFFPLALDMIARTLRAGGTVERAFETVADEIEGPVGKEFQVICQQIEVGLPFEDALRDSTDRVNNNDYNFFAVALIIQRNTGGSLADLISTIATVLRKREELRMKIKALSSEAKASGLIVGSLPFIALGAISYLKPDYVEVFQDDPTGQKLLLIVIGLISGAVFSIRSMIRFDVT